VILFCVQRFEMRGGFYFVDIGGITITA